MVDFHTGQDGVLQDLPRVWEGVPDPRKMVVDASWILEMRDQDTMLLNAGQYAKNRQCGPAPPPPSCTFCNGDNGHPILLSR